jgi:hypothetical protein
MTVPTTAAVPGLVPRLRTRPATAPPRMLISLKTGVFG